MCLNGAASIPQQFCCAAKHETLKVLGWQNAYVLQQALPGSSTESRSLCDAANRTWSENPALGVSAQYTAAALPRSTAVDS